MRLHSPTDVGNAVRSLREQIGVSQRELALAAGTGVRFIVELERGKPTCQLGKALAVLQTLGATVDLSGPTWPIPEPAEES